MLPNASAQRHWPLISTGSSAYKQRHLNLQHRGTRNGRGETQAIADHLKKIMSEKFGKENIKDHFADTRDTLCYATNDNQDSTYELLKTEADLAVVVGGYNSSNTSHIVELCERNFPTYFINSENEIIFYHLLHLHTQYYVRALKNIIPFLTQTNNFQLE